MSFRARLHQPTFATVCADIVAGKLPLIGDLSSSQLKAGAADCAIPVVAPDLPGCLALVVLRKGRIRIVGSYQAALERLSIDPARAAALPPGDERIHELLLRAEAFVRGEPDVDVMDLTNAHFSRLVVEQFHAGVAYAS